MEKELKYDEAVWKKTDNSQEWLSVEKITSIRNNDNDFFLINMKGNLFCPECYKANLVHNNAKTPYLSTLQNESHEPECSKICTPLSNEVYHCYSSNPNNFDTINRRLKSIIELIHTGRTKNNPFIFSDNGEYENSNNALSASNKHLNSKLAIPRKLITTLFKKSDYDVYKIFYGEVKIEWKETINKSFNLKLFNLLTNESICTITMSRTLHSYFLGFINGTKVKIAFNSIMKLSKGKYSDTYIGDPRLLIMKQC